MTQGSEDQSQTRFQEYKRASKLLEGLLTEHGIRLEKHPDDEDPEEADDGYATLSSERKLTGAEDDETYLELTFPVPEKPAHPSLALMSWSDEEDEDVDDRIWEVSVNFSTLNTGSKTDPVWWIYAPSTKGFDRHFRQRLLGPDIKDGNAVSETTALDIARRLIDHYRSL